MTLDIEGQKIFDKLTTNINNTIHSNRVPLLGGAAEDSYIDIAQPDNDLNETDVVKEQDIEQNSLNEATFDSVNCIDLWSYALVILSVFVCEPVSVSIKGNLPKIQKIRKLDELKYDILTQPVDNKIYNISDKKNRDNFEIYSGITNLMIQCFKNFFFKKNILFKGYENFNKISPKLLIDFDEIVEILETISVESSIDIPKDYLQIEYISLNKNRIFGNNTYSSKNHEQVNENANANAKSNVNENQEQSEFGKDLDTENDSYLTIVSDETESDKRTNPTLINNQYGILKNLVSNENAQKDYGVVHNFENLRNSQPLINPYFFKTVNIEGIYEDINSKSMVNSDGYQKNLKDGNML